MNLESIEISGYRSIGNTLKFYSLGVYRVYPHGRLNAPNPPPPKPSLSLSPA